MFLPSYMGLCYCKPEMFFGIGYSEKNLSCSQAFAFLQWGADLLGTWKAGQICVTSLFRYKPVALFAETEIYSGFKLQSEPSSQFN